MISKDTISLVRDRTDIVAVVSESVPTLKKRGRRFVGLCPFHEERTPSFHVNQESGLYHCFGCKESGDVFRFLERIEGYSFTEAVRFLAERAGVSITVEGGAPPSEAERRKKERSALYDVMQLAAAWYEEQLREHPTREHALAELGRRGLDPSNAAVRAFRVGYAPPGWDNLAAFLKRQGISPALAETVGLLAPRASTGSGRDDRGYYDRFRHRLMFAVLDVQGRVVAFSGRALPTPDDAGAADDRRDPPPKYVNSPETPIYTKGSVLFGLWQARHAIRQKEEAALVEGNFDVVSLHARGIDHVVAPLGTAFTEEQAKLLHRYAVRVTLLFDGDAAGRKAARAAEDPCRKAGLVARVATLPDRTDPDEFVRTRGGDALAHVLGRARGLVEYLIDAELDESFNAADSREAAARVDRVVAIIDRQTDPVERAMAEAYADRAAGRLDLVRSAPNAWGALKRKFLAMKTAAASVPTGPRPWQARIRPRQPGHEERKAIVGALLDFPVLLDDSDVFAVFDVLEGESARIVAAMRKAMRVVPGASDGAARKALDASEFLAQMPAVIQAFAAARLAAPVHDTLEEARATVSVNAKKLRESHVARETSEIVREQHRVVGDWETEVELMKHASTLVRQQRGLVGTGAARVEGAAAASAASARTRVGQKHRGNDGDEES